MWDHIRDEWEGYSHDQIRMKRNVYLKAIRHFNEGVGKIDLYDIERSHAMTFRDWWIDRKNTLGLQPHTANREINCLRRLLNVIYDIDGIDGTNPFLRVRIKAEPKKRRAPLTSEQIKNNLLAPGKLEGLHNDFQILIKLIINTGMRPVEAVGLSLGDIFLSDSVPYVYVRRNEIRA